MLMGSWLKVSNEGSSTRRFKDYDIVHETRPFLPVVAHS